MKGNIQLCKSDVCVKASGDYANAVLIISAVALVVVAIGYFATRLK